MNDTANGFADNQGSLQATITILPSIVVSGGSERASPSAFMASTQFTALAGLVLSGGGLQLSETTEGLERTHPAVRGEGNGYTGVLFVLIPLDGRMD
jgi:hypothetical protein